MPTEVSSADTIITPLTTEPTATPHILWMEAGRVLGNRYEIRECIGSGGMGTIYSARRIHIGDTVAVKVLRPDVVHDSQSRERFQREARAAAKLHHPNAVVIHDFGQDPDGTTYIVMELLEGRSLREVLGEEGFLPPTRVSQILKQACAGIEAAHRLGIIHRDLKPDNIILLKSHDETEHVKILDFGIAKLLDRTSEPDNTDPTLTQVGTVIGTPNYMSPEQCQGEPLDARSDVYSLGVVVYEMLTGVQPFTAKNSTGVVIKHVTEKPRTLTSLKPEIPAAVERVVLKALEKKPELRHQSALDLAREFESAVLSPYPLPHTLTPTPVKAETQVEVQTKNVSAPDSKASKSSRLPILAVAAAVIVLLIGGVGWWLYSGLKKPATAKKIEKPNSVSGATAALTPANVEPSVVPSIEATPPVAPDGMMIVMGGEFQMGRDNGEDGEGPAHPEKVKPFFLDKMEVTNEQYKEFIEAANYAPPPSWKNNTFPEGKEKYPVTDVTWEDANAYAKWAKKRLPTEEEWEFAARGTDGRLYPWGAEFQPGIANLKDEASDGKSNENITRVGSYPDGQSPYGMLDMIGNVWEWTSSSYIAYPGGKITTKAGYQDLKVIRGGSWQTPPKQATTTLRKGWPATRSGWPREVTPDYSSTGFRCAQDVP